MTERNLRKYHATLGIILSLFIFMQVGTGTLIAFNEFLGRGRHTNTERSNGDLRNDAVGHNDWDHEENLLQIVHHHGKQPFQALRVLLGIGILIMVISGTTIYIIARNRKKQSANKTL
jgi:uncharacterized iron-regulated membrane protein